MTSQDIYDLGFAIQIYEIEHGFSKYRYNSKTYHVRNEEIDRFRHKLDGRVLVRVEHCERLNET